MHAIINTIAANAGEPIILVNLALDAGLPPLAGGVSGLSGGSPNTANSGTAAGHEQETEKDTHPFDEDWSHKTPLGGPESHAASTDHQGNDAQYSYGSDGKHLKKHNSDCELELQKMLQRRRLAELAKKTAEAEYEAQKYKQATKRSLECSENSLPKSPTKKRRIAGTPSSASPASILSSPLGTSASAAAATLVQRHKILHDKKAKEEARSIRIQALASKLLAEKQTSAAAEQAQTDRKARIAAKAEKLLLEKRKNAEKAQAAKEEAERTARIAARAAELQKLNTAALAARLEADAMGVEMDCTIDAITEEEEASSAHQQAPAAMTDEAEAADVTKQDQRQDLEEEAMSIVGNSPCSFYDEAED